MTDSGMREAPHNLDAEQELLGLLLTNNRTIDIMERLEPRHFYEPLHGRIFDTARQLIAQDKTASPVTLQHIFTDDEALLEAGGGGYLAALAGAATTPPNGRSYVDAIIDLYARRQIVGWAAEAESMAFDTSMDGWSTPEIVESLTDSIFEIMPNEYHSEMVALGDVRQKAIELFSAISSGQGGVDIGIPQLSDRLGPIPKGALTILGGRPSMGKTALGIALADNAAQKGHGTLLFSLEMPSTHIWARLASRRARVPYSDLLQGRASYVDMSAVDSVEMDIPLIVDDRPSATVGYITMKAKQAKRRLAKQGKTLDLIMVDYLGLIKYAGKAQHKHLQVGEISKGLFELARNLDVAVVALAQLNRGVEGRDVKRPTLADLRDSGEIEQDAGTVIFIHRDHYYLSKQASDNTDAELEAKIAASKNEAEIIIAKQRNGPTGIVKLFVNLPTNEFSGLDRF